MRIVIWNIAFHREREREEKGPYSLAFLSQLLVGIRVSKAFWISQLLIFFRFCPMKDCSER